ncbi:hypothetical protein DFH07DRAFT_844665 [Mycena maculata]|uniref:F-box domain-containing protein n=1 Tax=Mycena maculata TaxID=230809 RepID=A0AAD7I4A5_9AGAR|nr:hypothetical protein DFH07DRAFT_844665 [Mycena maculata]
MLSTSKTALAADRARIADIDPQTLELECALRVLREETNLLQRRLYTSRPPSTSAFDADRARLAAIRRQSLDIERSSQVLREERTLLQARLDACTYPVLTLPTEVISEIFIRFIPVYPKCPPLIGLHSPNVLALICRKWREIALSMPELWRAFAPCFGNTRALTPLHLLQALEIWVRRSGSWPLSMELFQAPKRFNKTLSAHRARWEHLKLIHAETLLFSVEGTLPLLRSLHLPMLPVAGRLPTAPLLQTVTLEFHFHNFSAATLPWSQLTAITVNRILLHSCLDMLNATGNLVYCRVGIHFNPSDGLLSSMGDITLPYLESLILDLIGLPRTGFLDILTLPALRRFWVAESFLGTNPTLTLISFTSKSGCALKELGIIGSRIPRHVYRSGFPSSVSVRFKGTLDETVPGIDDGRR